MSRAQNLAFFCLRPRRYSQLAASIPGPASLVPVTGRFFVLTLIGIGTLPGEIMSND